MIIVSDMLVTFLIGLAIGYVIYRLLRGEVRVFEAGFAVFLLGGAGLIAWWTDHVGALLAWSIETFADDWAEPLAMAAGWWFQSPDHVLHLAIPMLILPVVIFIGAVKIDEIDRLWISDMAGVLVTGVLLIGGAFVFSGGSAVNIAGDNVESSPLKNSFAAEGVAGVRLASGDKVLYLTGNPGQKVIWNGEELLAYRITVHLLNDTYDTIPDGTALLPGATRVRVIDAANEVLFMRTVRMKGPIGPAGMASAAYEWTGKGGFKKGTYAVRLTSGDVTLSLPLRLF